MEKNKVNMSKGLMISNISACHSWSVHLAPINFWFYLEVRRAHLPAAHILEVGQI